MGERYKIESKILFSILVSGLFFFGWIYVRDFCHYFGISQLELSLDFNYYLICSFPALAIIFLVGLVFIPLYNKDKVNRYSNIIKLSIILIIIQITVLVSPTVIWKGISIVVVLIMFFLFLRLYEKLSKGKLFKNGDNGTNNIMSNLSLIVFGGAIYITLLVFSHTLAIYEAEQLVKGERSIYVSFKDYKNISESLKSKKFILIICSNGKYFVTEKNTNHTIVIPEEKNSVVYRYFKKE